MLIEKYALGMPKCTLHCYNLYCAVQHLFFEQSDESTFISGTLYVLDLCIFVKCFVVFQKC